MIIAVIKGDFWSLDYSSYGSRFRVQGLRSWGLKQGHCKCELLAVMI